MLNAGSFFLFANPFKEETIAAAAEMANRLLREHARVILEGWLYDVLNGTLKAGERCDLRDLREKVDAIISIGGDGTLLRTTAEAAARDIPVLGINMGRVGFLLEDDTDDHVETVQRLLAADYMIEERMMLRCKVNESPEVLVMNDVALTRGHNPSSIEVKAFADDEMIFISRGDGALAATPTGTTGYALSAGGPVVYPSMSCITIVPICSHILNQRPLVLPPDMVVRMTANAATDKPCHVIMDGQTVLPMNGQVHIRIVRSDRKAKFIRFQKQKFLSRLRLKQAEWSRE